MSTIKAILGVVVDGIKIVFDKICLALAIILIIGMCGLSLAVVVSIVRLMLRSLGVGL